MDEAALQSAYRHSSRHRYEIASSSICGCFQCQQIFPATDVTQWLEAGSCAVCPVCGTDSVIGNASGFPVDDREFLRDMHERWFPSPAKAPVRGEGPVVNVAELPLDSWTQGTAFAGSDVRIGALVGVKDLGISYSEVPPGKSGCPFHNHHVEDELFIVIEGEGTYRYGDQRFPIRVGSVLGAPAGGRETAHQIINTGTVPLKFYAISTMAKTEVCEYPDSGKFLVKSQRAESDKLRFVGREGQNALDYWDGEPGA